MDRRYRWYRWIAAVGLQTVRAVRRIRKRLAPAFQKIAGCVAFLYRKSFGRWAEGYRERRSELCKYKEMHGKQAARCVSELRRGMVCSVMNVAAPMIAIGLLFGTIQFWNQMDYGLSAQQDGEVLGVLKDETVIEEASELMYSKVSYDAVSQVELPVVPELRLQPSVNTAYAGADGICETLLAQSDEIVAAAGLYINGALLGAVPDAAPLSAFLTELLDAEKAAYGGEDACFSETVEIVEGLFAADSVRDFETLEALLAGPVQKEQRYRAKKGDTVESVARDYAVPVLFLSDDNGGLSGALRAGTALTVCERESLLHVLVLKTETYEQEISYGTVTTEDDTRYCDESIVTSEGIPGTEQRTDRVFYQSGQEVSRENVEQAILTEPVDEQVTVGTMVRPTGDEPGVASGIFSWPTPTLWTVTSEYGARWGTIHRGLDISGSGAMGEPIVASDAGVVSWVAFDDYGYGYHVEIDHGNGYITRYAHASDIVVSQGEKVAKGDVIAYVGSTGDSTGAHLHFEIIEYGIQVDPRYCLE